MNETEKLNLRIIEAALFASPDPVGIKTLRELVGDEADLGMLLSTLKEDYSERGVNLLEVDGCWVFRTAADLSDKLVIYREAKRKLSRSAMETLAIIAYHQPVTRAEIENIRGVSTSKGTLDVLIEAGWVRPGRRRESPGRPLTWITTTQFMDHFGLESLKELPGIDELKSAGLLDSRVAIDNVIDKEEDLFSSAEKGNNDD